MKKNYLCLLAIFTFFSCQENESEILKCNLTVDNGLTYSAGKKYSGTCNIFYNDSLLWKTRSYKNGMMTKEISYYLPGGELEYVGNNKKGEIHGDFVSYYRNGVKSIEGRMNMGYYDGIWQYWDEDGTLNKTLTYKNKELIDSIYHKN